MAKAVTVVGVGALGSHVVQLLRNEDVHLRIIDRDRVERKNIASQFHAASQTGKKKVVSLASSMAFLFKSQSIETRPVKLTHDNVAELLDGSDLVLDCLDNAESRRIVQGHCSDRRIACLHGALAADGGFGRVVWSESFAPDESTPGAATCENGEFLPFIALTAAYMAMAAQTFLATGKKVGFSVSPMRTFST